MHYLVLALTRRCDEDVHYSLLIVRSLPLLVCIHYLGLPQGVNISRSTNWIKIVDKFQSNLACWNTVPWDNVLEEESLSLNRCMVPFSTYNFSLYRAP